MHFWRKTTLCHHVCAHIVNMCPEIFPKHIFFENALICDFNGTKITEKNHRNSENDPFKDFMVLCTKTLFLEHDFCKMLVIGHRTSN